jgi:hypothetical protein
LRPVWRFLTNKLSKVSLIEVIVGFVPPAPAFETKIAGSHGTNGVSPHNDSCLLRIKAKRIKHKFFKSQCSGSICVT